MGACATKPKVLKAEAGEAPAPPPEEVAVETKLENGTTDGNATEIVVDNDVDSKPRSLGNLLIDQKEGNKESNEKEKTEEANPPEKQESTTPPPETEKPSENNPPEAEPPVSDSVTENKNIIVSSEKLTETPSEANKENDKKIEEKINEKDVPLEKTESSEKPTETEKEVKVITN